MQAEMSRHRQSEQQSRKDGDNKGWCYRKHRSEQRRNQNIVQRLRKESLVATLTDKAMASSM